MTLFPRFNRYKTRSKVQAARRKAWFKAPPLSLEMLEDRRLLTMTPTIVFSPITPVDVTYDGHAHGTTAEVYGADNVYLGSAAVTYDYGAGDSNDAIPPMDAGTYGVTATFAGNADYSSATNTETITIEQATPTVVVTPVSVTYDGNSHGTMAEAYGVDGEDLGPAMVGYSSGFAPGDAGKYKAIGMFAGNNDYTSAMGSACIIIAQATPTVMVDAVSAIYDSNQHGTTAEAYGVMGEDLGPAQVTYDSGWAPVDVGTYTATGTFAGNNDYTSAQGTASITITQATGATVVVTSASVTYNGHQQGTTAEAIGAYGEDLGPVPVYYNAGYTPVDVGSYTATGMFAGNNDYGPAQGTATFTITQAAPTVVVTPATITYNGQPQGTTAEAFGVNGEDLGPAQVSYSVGFEPTDAGSYTATGIYAGNNNYTAGEGTAAFTITKATPTVVVTPVSAGFDGFQHGTTAEAFGVNGEDLGPAQVTYSSGTVPVHAGTFTATGSFAGNSDYIAATGMATITIAQATPVISWSNPSAITNPTPLSGTQLDATTNVAGTFVYSPAAGIVLAAGAHMLSTTFTPTDTTDYTTATASVTIQVNAASSSGPGITVSGTTLIIVGGNSSSDQILINPIGSSNNGSTGVQVIATLNGVNASKTFSQPITTITITEGNGNENIQLSGSLTVTITAGNGNVNLSGGNDNVTVTLGNGNDNISLGNGVIVITAGNGNDSVNLGNGNDSVSLGNGNDNVSLGNGNDAVAVGNGNDNVALGNGNDAVTAGNGNDNISLGNGNDAVTAGNGNDNISLGNGNDAVTAGNGNDNISLGNGNDAVTAGNGNNNISLGNGGDAVIAGNGRDNISLGNGNDAVTVGNGNDSIGLGNGNDAVTAGNGNDNISLGNGNDAVVAGNGNDSVSLGNGNDSVALGNGNDSANLGNGNDVVMAGNGNDSVNLGNGNNTVTVGNGNDNISLGNGNDAVTAGNGNDNVYLGNGNDSVTVGNGNDNIGLGNGNDAVTAGNGRDNINLGNGNDVVTAGNGNNNISMGNGNDAVTVGDGNDNISLGNGSDVVTAGNGNVSVNLGNGNNTVTLGNGNDSSNLGNGSNVLVEGAGNDNVNAGNGNNLIVAGLGQHSVQVGNGKNILIDGSVKLNNAGDSLRQVLNDWVQNGSQASNVANIHSRLTVTDNTGHANRMTAGNGLDWFWATYAKDTLSKKSTDLLN